MDESESLRAKLAALEASITEEREASAVAIEKATEASAAAAAAAAAAESVAAPAPAPIGGDDSGSSEELEAMRATIAELESALDEERKSSAGTKGTQAGAGSAQDEYESVTVLGRKVAELEAEVSRKDEELASLSARVDAAAVSGGGDGDGGEDGGRVSIPTPAAVSSAEATELRERVSELQAALEAEKAVSQVSRSAPVVAAATAVARATPDGDGATTDDAGEATQLRERVSALEAALATEKKATARANASAAGGGAGGDTLRARVAELEKELVQARTAAAEAAAAAATASGREAFGMGDDDDAAESDALRKVVGELEAALSRER